MCMIIGIKHGPRLCRVFSNILKCSIIVRGGIQPWGTGHRYHLSWRLWQPNLIECPKKRGKIIIAFLGLRTPNTNAEIIEILSDAGYISKGKADTYIKMCQFRNRIIHVYNHIDTKTLYDILTNELGDIKNLYKDLLKIIDKYK